MVKIGLLSDTHGYLDPSLLEYFRDCDEIWHAGDIGNVKVSEELSKFKPFKAVWGNIDGQDIRQIYPENLRFKSEGLEVWIKHIGGYPGKYDRSVRNEIFAGPPGLFISGHSHILKVMFDKKLNLLHINPGAAGKAGLHRMRTAVRFTIDDMKVKDLEVIELGRA
jgi:putative phosphoesterase